MINAESTLWVSAVVSGITSPVTSGVTWTSSNTSVATIDSTGKVTGVSAGTASITASDGGVASTSVVLTVLGIQSITAPAAVTIASGTNPSTSNLLPATVKATYTDGTEGDEPVTWDYSQVTVQQYGARNGTTISVPGTINGFAAGVQGTINVSAATVSSVDGYSTALTVACGQTPTLSASATVHWSNGDQESRAIAWEAKAADAYQLHAGGTVTVNGTVDAGETSPRAVTCTVTVSAAVIQTVADLSKVTAYTDITAEEIAKQLPATVA